MNRSEAYSALGLSDDATDDEVKSRFRELSKKLHPDKNKGDPSAEQKFKDINSAYQRITNPSAREQQEDNAPDIFNFGGAGGAGGAGGFGFGFGGFENVINNFQKMRFAQNVQLSTHLTFAESVLGCQKDLKYSRQIKCNVCNGQGKIKINTDCKKCGGRGQHIVRNGNMMYVSQCECASRITFKKCANCNDGTVTSQSTVTVNIPGGVTTQSILRLNNMGNFVGSLGQSDQYTEALLSLTIDQENDLRLEEEDVVCDLNISLLEALKGCEKTVKTVLGTHNIKINPLSKNKEEIVIPNVGVNKIGSQRVILNVNYPDNVDQLIKVME